LAEFQTVTVGHQVIGDYDVRVEAEKLFPSLVATVAGHDGVVGQFLFHIPTELFIIIHHEDGVFVFGSGAFFWLSVCFNRFHVVLFGWPFASDVVGWVFVGVCRNGSEFGVVQVGIA